MELLIQKNGTVRCVYDEQIPLSTFGAPSIQRASHVEPNCEGRWHADLSPVEGPTLGPFASRSEAIAAEMQWLRENWLAGNQLAKNR